MAYEDAPACKMLATHCVVCGRPLVDAISVQVGRGPECRRGDDEGIPSETRDVANKLVYRAAVAAQRGQVEQVIAYADSLRELGLPILADKVAFRFSKVKAKALRNPEITIKSSEGRLFVRTPFRRSDKEAFISASSARRECSKYPRRRD